MAQPNGGTLTVDGEQLARSVVMRVVVKRTGRLRFRRWLMLRALEFARWAGPADIRLSIDDHGELVLLTCPFCGHHDAEQLPEKGVWYPRCGYCGWQYMVRDMQVVEGQTSDRTAADRPLRKDCSPGCHCGFVEPYGFVPEAGCPIHDPDNAA